MQSVAPRARKQRIAYGSAGGNRGAKPAGSPKRKRAID